MTAESIVVFGSESFMRSAQEQTGAVSGKSGFGRDSPAPTKVTAPASANATMDVVIRRKWADMRTPAF